MGALKSYTALDLAAACNMIGLASCAGGSCPDAPQTAFTTPFVHSQYELLLFRLIYYPVMLQLLSKVS